MSNFKINKKNYKVLNLYFKLQARFNERQLILNYNSSRMFKESCDKNENSTKDIELMKSKSLEAAFNLIKN